MNIIDEAVIAAAKVLYADKISNHAGDNAPQIIDACETVARRVLEAAIPYIIREAKADAWDEGSQERWDWQWRDDAEPLTNPYRSQA